MMRNFRLLIVVISLFIVVACNGKPETNQQQRPAPLVEVQQIQRGNFPVEFSFVGEVTGDEYVEIRSQASGTLLDTLYTEGRFVKEGDILFEIDPATYEAQLAAALGSLEQANAALNNATLSFKRIAALYQKKAVSESDYDNSLAALETARATKLSAAANVQNARILLGYTKVKAPFSGYSGKAAISDGNLVSVGTSLTVIYKVDPVDVEFSISNSDYNTIRSLQRKGQLDISKGYAEAYDGEGMQVLGKGNLEFIESFMNATTGSVGSRASFDNKDLIVLPGQFLTIKATGLTLLNSIMIPQKAVLQTQRGQMVISIGEGDVATYKPIKIDGMFGNYFLVGSGIEDGERIVVEGTNKVVPNKPVKIATSDK